MAASITKPHTISVGNCATSPVRLNDANTGIKKANEIIARTDAIAQKNTPGLYVLNKRMIVFKTLNPSEYVFSFDSLPAGLSL